MSCPLPDFRCHATSKPAVSGGSGGVSRRRSCEPQSLYMRDATHGRQSRKVRELTSSSTGSSGTKRQGTANCEFQLFHWHILLVVNHVHDRPCALGAVALDWGLSRCGHTMAANHQDLRVPHLHMHHAWAHARAPALAASVSLAVVMVSDCASLKPWPLGPTAEPHTTNKRRREKSM